MSESTLSRYINLADYPLAHPPAVAWIKANGLDPLRLPREQTVRVGGGKIHAVEFVRDERGYLEIREGSPLLNNIVTDLISAPENHGL